MKTCHNDHGDSEKGTVSIIVIDNDDIVRSTLCSYINKRARFSAVGLNPDTQDPLERIKCEQPHIILLDLMWNSQPRGGWCLLPKISRDCPHTAVIIVSARAELADVNEAWRKGIAGYVRKSQWHKELTEALLIVSKGKSFFSPWLGARVWRASKETESLSPREREVFYLVVRDLSPQFIAKELCIEVDTVHVHMSHIRQRIGHQNGWKGIMMEAQRDPTLLDELSAMERRVFDLYGRVTTASQEIATTNGCPEADVMKYSRSVRRELNCHPDGWKGIAREEGDID